jgi:vacuolar-type H+-ATPase subunit F/Vma7
MSRIVALGERERIQGYSIAGVEAVVTDGTDDTVEAWRSLPRDVAVVILSPRAAASLGARTGERPDVLTAVLP